ncbi:hypothetical protein BU25DRAFT_493203 [Macroventuria anomochaeta]|uniref:Uncharacterized protein n=1 Tax=Macroventuria anomochaeta TaxID=301207 RepID=A0ACB6RSI0_9PLEO|nr:uncharacterized protein BU25DRAFT_493203 [Macroventuria anomochaeta]KAF2624856.1 hypothetical protein BU25DRAFT_493203 [Macroventuria anomochaeta]
MAGKRKHEEPTPTLPNSQQDTTITPHRQKQRKKQNTPTVDTTYTISQILAFKASIPAITDWTSPTISPKHIQVIYWFDVLGLSKAECAKRYPNKDGKSCSVANIFKVYNMYAPRLYAEKGVGFVPLGKRGIARAQPVAPVSQKKGHIGGRHGTTKVSRLDVKLKRLFEKLPKPTSPALHIYQDQDVRVACSDRAENPAAKQGETEKFEAASSYTDVLEFVRKVNDTTYGPPSGSHMSRACAVQYCKTVREALEKNPGIRTAQYGPEISPDTISRFTACMSSTLQSHLPTHVTTSFGTFEQQWTMVDLEDLYVFAVTMGAHGVCDLVTDRWVEEIQRSEPRIVMDDFFECHLFDILHFGPEFLNFLHANDEKGLRFFLSVLVTHGQAGYALLRDTHLGNWHSDVKKALIATMKNESAIDLVTASRETICARFHHHGPEEQIGCFQRVPLQPATYASAITAKAPALRARIERPCYDMDIDDGKEGILQISIPDFPYVHNRDPRHDAIIKDPLYSNPRVSNRLQKHRNGYMDDRMQYANPKFNAHHDAAEVCEEKLRMVREKLQSFREEGIEVSEEVKKTLGGPEGLGGAGGHEEEESE